jgi:hypothetical protein
MESKLESKSGEIRERYGGIKDSECKNASIETKRESKGQFDEPQLDVSAIRLPKEGDDGFSLLGAALELEIDFSLNIDAPCSCWTVKLLVDCASKRQIKVLGQTPERDYVTGSNKMCFAVDYIDFSGFKKSTLANAGLLMAGFLVDGKEIATVNCVVNVIPRDGDLVRQILSPI